jgi:putrescine aminotransferase
MDPALFSSREALYEAFSEHVNPGKPRVLAALGLDLVAGERQGAKVRDAFTGRAYYNCHCNGGVFNLGHRNEQVIRAVREALERLDIGNHHLVSPLRTALAERLAATTFGLLPGVVFGVSGGEANDLAIKVARGVTGRHKVVSARGGYHGHTGLSLAAGDPAYRDPFGPNLPGFVQVPFNDLGALDREVGDDTAAVLLEGIRPDAITTGKGLSGGIYPIAATLLARELHDFFAAHPFIHISTFGGAEPGCAAALAVLDVTLAPGFLERVRALGARFARGLSGLPFELRQRGLFMGWRFAEPGGAIAAMRSLYQAGVLAVFAGNDPSVLQFLPPLTLTDEEADEIVAIVRRVFTATVS